jgi:hypothetical protein
MRCEGVIFKPLAVKAHCLFLYYAMKKLKLYFYCLKRNDNDFRLFLGSA